MQSVRIDTFSENRLSILGFDSHDVYSKIMKKYENFEKMFLSMMMTKAVKMLQNILTLEKIRQNQILR